MIEKITINIYGRSQQFECAIISQEDFDDLKSNGITYEKFENYHLSTTYGYEDEEIQLFVNDQEIEDFSKFFNLKYALELEVYEESLSDNNEIEKNLYVLHDEGSKATNFSLDISEPFLLDKIEIVFDHVRLNGEVHCVTYTLKYDGKELELVDGGSVKYDDFSVMDKDGNQTYIELIDSDDDDQEDEDEEIDEN